MLFLEHTKPFRKHRSNFNWALGLAKSKEEVARINLKRVYELIVFLSRKPRNICNYKILCLWFVAVSYHVLHVSHLLLKLTKYSFQSTRTTCRENPEFPTAYLSDTVT